MTKLSTEFSSPHTHSRTLMPKTSKGDWICSYPKTCSPFTTASFWKKRNKPILRISRKSGSTLGNLQLKSSVQSSWNIWEPLSHQKGKNWVMHLLIYSCQKLKIWWTWKSQEPTLKRQLTPFYWRKVIIQPSRIMSSGLNKMIHLISRSFLLSLRSVQMTVLSQSLRKVEYWLPYGAAVKLNTSEKRTTWPS